MTKATIFIFCFLCVSLAHKDKKEEINSIYKPFNDMPKTANNDILKTDEILINDNDNVQQNKQVQFQEIDETVGYGLVFGTFLIAFLLMKSCATHERTYEPMVGLKAPICQNQMMHTSNTNQKKYYIKNKILWHKNEIKRLEYQASQYQKAEKIERRRQQMPIKVYQNQMQMQQTIQPKVHLNQNMNYQYQFHNQQYIPIGRSMPKRDSHTTYKSEYPVI